jgi:hypothetical protein
MILLTCFRIQPFFHSLDTFEPVFRKISCSSRKILFDENGNWSKSAGQKFMTNT